jgi:hypothetical protein
MSISETESTMGNPSPRTVRYWLGFLVVLLLLNQIGAIAVSVSQVEVRHDLDRQFGAGMTSETQGRGQVVIRPIDWQRFAVATATSLLAMLTMIGGVGLILNAPWGWSAVRTVAALQIISTLLTQVAEAVIKISDLDGPQRVLFTALVAVIGVVLWNIIPVGVFILAGAGRPLAGSNARLQTM